MFIKNVHKIKCDLITVEILVRLNFSSIILNVCIIFVNTWNVEIDYEKSSPEEEGE